jgi:hypothetical protein
MKRLKNMILVILGILVVMVLITVTVINQPQFGRNPSWSPKGSFYRVADATDNWNYRNKYFSYSRIVWYN